MKESLLFDDNWYQIFHFLTLNDLYKVVQTNKHLSFIAMHHIKTSEQLVKKWYHSHQLFLKNSNLYKKTKTYNHYTFVFDREQGLKIGFKHNKYRNSLNVCVISYWMMVKKFRIKFGPGRYIWVQYSKIHKHEQKNLYYMHIFDIGKQQMVHFYDVVLNTQFLTHIRLEMKQITKSLSSVRKCNDNFRKSFSIGSTSFIFQSKAYIVGSLILDVFYFPKFNQVFFLCQKSTYLFDALLCRLESINVHLHNKNIIIESIDHNIFTVQKNAGFYVFERIESQGWILCKTFNVQESREQLFHTYCPFANKVLSF